MKPTVARFFTLALASLLASTLVACGDDFGQSCDMPNTPQFNALCGGDSETGSDATCVFTNNPQCSTRACARYQGSSDFCTVLCDPNAPSCPSNGVCYAQPGRPNDGFCVPLSIYGFIGN